MIELTPAHTDNRHEFQKHINDPGRLFSGSFTIGAVSYDGSIFLHVDRERGGIRVPRGDAIEICATILHRLGVTDLHLEEPPRNVIVTTKP